MSASGSGGSADRLEAVAEGRVFRLRVMDAGDMLDLIEAAGENAGNRAWLRFAMLVCSVAEIDGVPAPFPRDGAGVRALARRVGVAGLEAAQAVLAAREDGVSEAGERDVAKN